MSVGEQVIELRQLRYAVATADAHSFSRAASALNVKQSTLSRRIAALDPVERKALGKRIVATSTILERACSLAAVAREYLSAPAVATISDLRASLDFLSVTPLPKGTDPTALTVPLWTQGSDQLYRLIQAGRDYSALWRDAEQHFNDAGLAADYSAIRSAVVIKGASLFRFLDGNYRAQLALLKSYLNDPLPKPQNERLELVDAMIAAQSAKEKFEAAASAGNAFGSAWKSEDSDWDLLNTILHWRGVHSSLPNVVWNRLANLSDTATLEAAREELGPTLEELANELAALFSDLDLDLRRAFGVGDSDAIPAPALAERLLQWAADLEGLPIILKPRNPRRAHAAHHVRAARSFQRRGNADSDPRLAFPRYPQDGCNQPASARHSN